MCACTLARWRPLCETVFAVRIMGEKYRRARSNHGILSSMPTPTNHSCLTTLMLALAVVIMSVKGHSMPQSSPSAASSILARSQQDASALVGTWELTDFSRRTTDGRITAPYGSHPAGQITYDADGHVMALLMHEERNEAGGRASPREVQAEFSAYFGTYTVDATQRIVMHDVRGSLSAERASGELRRHYELKDGSLILTFTRPQDGATNTLVWKRISRVRP